MQAPRKLLSLLIPVMLALGCGFLRPSSTAERPEPARPDGAVADEHDSMLTLADFLKRLPGVHVMGSGANTRVEIRGASSFFLSGDPLYVLDGQAAGNNYAHVAGLVPAKHIDYVQVLKGSDAAIYGVRGGNGVIVIVTKK